MKRIAYRRDERRLRGSEPLNHVRPLTVSPFADLTTSGPVQYEPAYQTRLPSRCTSRYVADQVAWPLVLSGRCRVPPVERKAETIRDPRGTACSDRTMSLAPSWPPRVSTVEWFVISRTWIGVTNRFGPRSPGGRPSSESASFDESVRQTCRVGPSLRPVPAIEMRIGLVPTSIGPEIARPRPHAVSAATTERNGRLFSRRLRGITAVHQGCRNELA